MFLILWWIWSYRQLAALEKPDGVVWPDAVIAERTAEARFTFRLAVVAVTLTTLIALIYVVVGSNVEASAAALRQCEGLLGHGALVETTNCIIEHAASFARANSVLGWASAFFWIVAIV